MICNPFDEKRHALAIAVTATGTSPAFTPTLSAFAP
jgi:hypothetical protein